MEETQKSFKKNGFNALIFPTKEEVISYLKTIVPDSASIGYGGSKTLEQIGFFEQFNKINYPNLIDRNSPDLLPEDKSVLQKNALTSDFFFSSANGVSATGELVLVDKWGNRNGAMTYGPGKRVFVVGKNKICLDLDSALKRAKDQASVQNNRRFDTGNPCIKTGKCMNCNSPQRLCSITTIIHRCQPPGSILVLLVNEELGF